jgi:hypothetical protein
VFFRNSEIFIYMISDINFVFFKLVKKESLNLKKQRKLQNDLMR